MGMELAETTEQKIVAMVADVTEADHIDRRVNETEEMLTERDMAFANAGIAGLGEKPNTAWFGNDHGASSDGRTESPF